MSMQQKYYEFAQNIMPNLPYLTKPKGAPSLTSGALSYVQGIPFPNLQFSKFEFWVFSFYAIRHSWCGAGYQLNSITTINVK